MLFPNIQMFGCGSVYEMGLPSNVNYRGLQRDVVVVAPDPCTRVFVFPGYQNTQFFAWHREAEIPRAPRNACESGKSKGKCSSFEARSDECVIGEEGCVPRRALMELCV